MPHVSYSAAQRREAVALARVIGAEACGKRLGIDWRTVQRWMVAAGDPPGLEGDTATWARLFELSASSVEAELVGGKLSAVQKASIAGIAQRNLDKLKDRPAPQAASAVAVKEPFFDWLVHTAIECDPEATVEEVVAVQRGLLIVANAEDRERIEGDERLHGFEYNGPHRSAILAWIGGNPATEAGDVLEWAQNVVRGWLEEHGTLRAWHASEVAKAERETLIRHRTWVLFKDGGTPFPEAVKIATEITDAA